jgi:hypothetical protein
VRELVEQAGIDVSDWAKDRNDVEIKNPNANIYKSFKWSFGGAGRPIALCIWHEEIDWVSVPPVCAGNTKTQQEQLNALGNIDVSPGVKSRLGIKVRRSRDFQLALQEAHRKQWDGRPHPQRHRCAKVEALLQPLKSRGRPS